MTLFLTVASGPDARLSKDEIDTMLNAGARASKNRYLNRGELSLIYSAMLPLVRNEDNNVKLKALDVIKRATILVFGHKVCNAYITVYLKYIDMLYYNPSTYYLVLCCN